MKKLMNILLALVLALGLTTTVWAATTDGDQQGNPSNDPPSQYYYYSAPQEETKPEAPKTFDAGIAVYGVTALASLTGAAVVIKKK